MRQRSPRLDLDASELRRAGGYRCHQGTSPLPSPSRSVTNRNVVTQDIFRRYPQRYEGIIPTLCASLDELDEPEAKASLIWILGEYADKISNADELIGSFLDNYVDEPVQVQLQALTAVVKLFLHRPDEAQALVQKVLALATKTADSADLRDRAYIQWRLLSSDTAVAKVRVLFPLSAFAGNTDTLLFAANYPRRPTSHHPPYDLCPSRPPRRAHSGTGCVVGGLPQARAGVCRGWKARRGSDRDGRCSGRKERQGDAGSGVGDGGGGPKGGERASPFPSFLHFSLAPLARLFFHS